MKRMTKVLLVSAIVLALAATILAVVANKQDAEKEATEVSYQELAEAVKVEEPEIAKTAMAAVEEETEATEEVVPVSEAEPYVSPVDFDALHEINEEIMGWIKIDDTAIDYPICHRGGDSEFYLSHDVNGNKAFAGAIFLDGANRKECDDRHEIVYGHHMKNGSMFKDIVKFKDEKFFSSHREFSVYLEGEERKLYTIACVEASGDDASNCKVNFASTEEFRDYIDEKTAPCSFRDVPEGSEYSRLWSFVTCDYEYSNARCILYAIEVE